MSNLGKNWGKQWVYERPSAVCLRIRKSSNWIFFEAGEKWNQVAGPLIIWFYETSIGLIRYHISDISDWFLLIIDIYFPVLPYITHFNQRVTFEDFYPYNFITRRSRKTSRAASNRASPSLVTLAPKWATLDLPRPMVALFGVLLQRPDDRSDQSGLPLLQTNKLTFRVWTIYWWLNDLSSERQTEKGIIEPCTLFQSASNSFCFQINIYSLFIMYLFLRGRCCELLFSVKLGA